MLGLCFAPAARGAPRGAALDLGELLPDPQQHRRSFDPASGVGRYRFAGMVCYYGKHYVAFFPRRSTACTCFFHSI